MIRSQKSRRDKSKFQEWNGPKLFNLIDLDWMLDDLSSIPRGSNQGTNL